jgi:DNA-3-methyladenine glycosylase II
MPTEIRAGQKPSRRRVVRTKNVDNLPEPERWLWSRDAVLAKVINSEQKRWPCRASEDPIWGLLRMVMAQQVSTQMARRIADRVKAAYPQLGTPHDSTSLDVQTLRIIGLSTRRAECCATINERAGELSAAVASGREWKDVLGSIKGIGPWTIAVFQIFVLRKPDVLPQGDIGLQRAVTTLYGEAATVADIAEHWRPYRSVACWYLWRTLGNDQLD